jgi:hypothetical protein
MIKQMGQMFGGNKKQDSGSADKKFKDLSKDLDNFSR